MGKLVKRLSLGALLLVFVLATSAFGQTEILVNGDFESWADSTSPTGWTKVENITKDSLEVHGGTYSAKHVGGTKDLGQYVTVMPGYTYDISIWYKIVPNDSTDARIWCVWRSEGTSDYTYNGDELRGPDGAYLNNNGNIWTEYTTSVVAPENADTLYFEVRTYSGAITYWDDFSVIETAPPPEDPNDYFIPQGSHAQGYVSLEAAVDSLNIHGVSGMINLVLDADTLRENSFTFNVPGLDADSNITVKPAPGRDVVLIVAGGASHGNGDQMIGFDKGYITFDGSNDGTDSRNLIVTTEETGIEVPFGLNTADADMVVIKNLIIKNLDNGVTNFKYGAVINDIGGIEAFTVDNCQIGSAQFPVYRDGVAIWGTSSTGSSQGIITNNVINAGARGIEAYFAGECTFNNNTINLYQTTSGTTYAYAYGVRMSWVETTEIANNVFNLAIEKSIAGSQVRGVKIYSNPADAVFTIVNNTFDLGSADETNAVSGIEFGSNSDARTVNIYHNTFVLNDNASTSGCSVINQTTTGPAVIDLKNNILINKHTGNTTSSAITLGVNASLTSDNNILVSDQNCANYQGTNYADLAAWKAAGMDAGSDSVNVTFVSATDLHLAAPSDEDVDLAMPMIATVTKDIDGDARGGDEGKFSYAGADEGALIPTNDIDEDFSTSADLANWRSDNSGYTVRAIVDSVLELSDPGWGFDARRNVTAEPNTFFKATAKIKTGSFDTSTSQYLYFGVDGLTTEPMQVSCISEDGFTTFTVIGLAENASGTLYIAGQGAGGADTAWVDEYTFDDNYLPAVTSISTIADVRLMSAGDEFATMGVVTTTTNYGSSGPVYIQDDNAGLAVYNYNVAQNVALGDEILITGKLYNYNGLLEASPTYDYIVLSSDNVVEPIVITAADMADAETYEGMLVTIQGCDTLSTGLTWPAEGSNGGVTLLDNLDSAFTCYIDKDTDIDGSPVTTWPVNITGIQGDYRGAQLLPRSLADFQPNNPPAAFTILDPADESVVSSLDDAMLVEQVIDGDTVKTLMVRWETAVDNDPEDLVTYELMVGPDGPDEVLSTTDTVMYIPLEEEKPYEMNGTYEVYVVATDLSGGVTNSDTITFTFDFPAPPVVVYSDVVLLDGVPTYYAQFDLPFTAAPANFKVVDWSDNGSVVTATAIDTLGDNALLITAAMVEDHMVSLAYSDITTPGGDVTVEDTTMAKMVYIPFSENHPEDVTTIETFETSTGSFWAPTGSGSTTGLLTTSTFAVSDEAAYRGTKSGKLVLLDDPAKTGWYVRLYHGKTYDVAATSTLFLMVKGSTTAKVEMRISIADPSYEQGPWTEVSLSADDWQVVSFDLNGPAEGWINGNGTVDGATVKVEAIHMRCAEDVDVTLYLDEFTERKVISPVDITFNVIMAKRIADGLFNPVSDYVDIAGTMNSWNGTTMTNYDGDSTYSVMIPLMPYSTENFKFRINGSWDNDKHEFPNDGPARVLVVPTAAAEYTYWFNDDTLEVAIDGIPTEFVLHQNYPNPFNPTTTINFDLPNITDVSLVIYDITGRKVRTLVNNSSIDAGYKKIVWNGRDDFGNGVATGMYIYRLVAGDFVDVKKMTFLK